MSIVALHATLQRPRAHNKHVCPNIVCRPFSLKIRSCVKVGKECVTVYGAKWENKYGRDQLRWEFSIRPLT